ncbi:uncharacterized protein EV420DRAFT_1530703 [Desarmillaria tabescens]|uniref:Uncharacterized protein n=1 Tax=Armillaria tabescens TaxID=1929756 RepID=A0AA39TNQ9_ARMTA|nr:uncharacterized protein EV420DRAFT_1530703 [Desarmillaria tabescens]KAK0461173.1 hypothetical protein EV420DRAFT_1530703 [Desarmillaria tabescens]
MDEESPTIPVSDPVPAHHASPVVAFIIGLAIILLASVLNAAGLNLTKLDHVRTQAIPKASRRKDWLRPLWLLGMLLYILSQLIGSTLALEYMRAEYVAPLGSTSLVFNFLFARFLVGTPVTSTDIYGTIVVIIGVVGIVAFGSINSGLATETDVEHLTQLWRRGGWLSFFFVMSFALILLLYFTSKLDELLGNRGHIVGDSDNPVITGGGQDSSLVSTARRVWAFLQLHTTRQSPWTLGIGWACCGGGLAGGTLVFAKATVKLLSGSLSHQNPGNQFGHVAPIFTIVLLVITCCPSDCLLEPRTEGLLTPRWSCPCFTGVYTATGFLDSLIFNNEVDSYQSWTLFLIFVSILILISGVVLLTHKKPEPGSKALGSASAVVVSSNPRGRKLKRASTSKVSLTGEADDHHQNDDEEQVLWTVGDASDAEEIEDEDIDHHQHPLNLQRNTSDAPRIVKPHVPGEEGESEDADRDSDSEGDVDTQRHPVDTPRQSTHNDNSFKDDSEEFGAWTSAGNLR